LLRFCIVTLFPELAEDLPKEVEVFFREKRGSFPESRTATPSPVSSISAADFQSVKILGTPPLFLATSHPTLSNSQRCDVPKLLLKAATEGEGS
jgi:hypothetical protein